MRTCEFGRIAPRLPQAVQTSPQHLKNQTDPPDGAGGETVGQALPQA
jgi:hypothetical protein